MVPIPVSRGPQGLHSLELSLKPICRCPSLANCTPCPTPLSNYRGRYPPTVSTWEVMVNVAGEPWPPPAPLTRALSPHSMTRETRQPVSGGLG